MTEKITNTASQRNTASRRTGSATSRASGSGRSRSGGGHSQSDTMWLLAGGVVIVLLVIAIILVSGRNNSGKPGKETKEAETETEETLSDEIVYGDYILDLSGIPGLSGDAQVSVRNKSRAEIYNEAAKLYDWSLSIVNGKAEVGNVVKPTVNADQTTEAATMGDAENPDSAVENTEGVAALTEITVSSAIPVPDMIEPEIKKVVEDIFADDKVTRAERRSMEKASKEAASESGEASSDETVDKSLFLVTMPDVTEGIEEIATYAEDMWYREAKGEGIGSFDPATEKFLMEGAKDGCYVDKEKLVADLTAAIGKGKFTGQIEASLITIPAASAAKNGEYKIIASYTTKTTNNAVRNKNVSLACKALNGTIVRAGEEFSYNSAVGERTVEKGYGEAGAYLNGEVVQEVGGGVCQVSSTLYNAVLKAGLKTTKRTSHTFKPTYVTPGMDATVSWGGPDYRFANVIEHPEISYDTTYAIGIYAHYSDNTVTVSIYGRPVLKPGYELSLESEQTGEKEVVRVLIPPEDTEKQPTTGDKGSSWRTYLITKKDGQQISRTEDHNTYYSGHTEYYRDTELTSETLPEEGESTEPYTGPIGPGMPSDAYTQSPLVPGENNGPGSEHTTEAENPQNPGGPGSETQSPERPTDTNEEHNAPGDNGGPMIVDSPDIGGMSGNGGGNPVNAPGGGSAEEGPMAPGGIVQDGP